MGLSGCSDIGFLSLSDLDRLTEYGTWGEFRDTIAYRSRELRPQQRLDMLRHLGQTIKIQT